MKTPPRFLKAGATILALAVLLGLAANAKAQINETKVERDATGIYQGQASGARFRVTYDAGGSFAGTVDPVAAKARVPVKDGRLSSAFRDNEFPGTGRAVAKGAERRSTVTRGGKRVVVKAVGTMDLAEEPRKGIWKGGVITGNLDDRGAKWSANAKSGAYQRNASVDGNPPDHTKRVTGMALRGRG